MVKTLKIGQSAGLGSKGYWKLPMIRSQRLNGYRFEEVSTSNDSLIYSLLPLEIVSIVSPIEIND